MSESYKKFIIGEKKNLLGWIKYVQLFVYTDITPFVFDNLTEDNRIKLVSPEAMIFWIIGFTHKTYNPNPGKNYEVLEFTGDRMEKAAYSAYMTINYPDITDNQIAELETYYVSKKYQGNQAKALGLDKYVLSRIPIDLNIREDLLEAMFGALSKAGDLAFGLGFGYRLCYNFFDHLFKNVKMNFNLSKGRAITRVKQIHEKFDANWKFLERIKPIYDESKKMFKMEIPYTRELVSILKLTNTKLSNFNPNDPKKKEYLAIGYGQSQEATKVAAYTKALNKLVDGFGITDKYIELVRVHFNREDNTYGKTYKNLEKVIKEKWNKQNVENPIFSLDFTKRFKSLNKNYIQVIGLQQDRTKVILSTSDEIIIPNKAMNIKELKQKALMEAINNI